MKLVELKNIFSPYTNVKLVIDGDNEVYQGYWSNVPFIYGDYIVENIIPIKHPGNDKLGMASILIDEGKCDD